MPVPITADIDGSYLYNMSFLNVEIKARSINPAAIRDYLLHHQAEYKGMDEQTDTYFNVAHGRLKLREGNIENNLIFYVRDDYAGPKDSHFRLTRVDDVAGLKSTLEESLGIKVIVKKKREIWYIGNVKFHIDEVNGLGSFVEIEAGNMLAELTKDELQQQCEFYMKAFGINEKDLVEFSYSDLLMVAVI